MPRSIFELHRTPDRTSPRAWTINTVLNIYGNALRVRRSCILWRYDDGVMFRNIQVSTVPWSPRTANLSIIPLDPEPGTVFNVEVSFGADEEEDWLWESQTRDEVDTILRYLAGM